MPPAQHPDSALGWPQFFGDIQERFKAWTADPGLIDWLSTCRLMGRRLPHLSPEQRTARWIPPPTTWPAAPTGSSLPPSPTIQACGSRQRSASRPQARPPASCPPEDAEHGHSLAAGYVRWQVERNRAALGRACLDTVFLPNPERTSDRAVLPIVLREAFAVLEEAAAAGHLSTYDIATWSGFTHGLITVDELDRLAADSPDHRLHEEQLPINPIETDALECGRSRIPQE